MNYNQLQQPLTLRFAAIPSYMKMMMRSSVRKKKTMKKKRKKRWALGKQEQLEK